MKWNDLTMSQRSDLMKLYLKHGITSLDAMKEHYNSFATGGHLYEDGGPDNDKYSFLRREPEVAVADNTRYVRPISDVEIDRASGLPEGTTTIRRIISAQAGRQQPVIKQDNATDETHKSINKEVKKAQAAKKVNDVANAVAAATSIPATVVAPEVMTPIFALQGFNDATDVLSKEGNLNTEDYGRLGLDALFMLPMFNTAGNYLRFNTNLGRDASNLIKNWRLSVPKDVNRYYRIVGKTGDPIGDAIESGVIRAGGANPKLMKPLAENEMMSLETSLLKPHDYPMFAKGKPWQGGTARTAFDVSEKPIIIRSKSNTGPIVWEESNKDFRHKGHAGIFRPSFYGDVNASPTQYFEWWEPKKFGYLRHEFPNTYPYLGEFNPRTNTVNNPLFSSFLGEGAEQAVFDNGDNVLKVHFDQGNYNLAELLENSNKIITNRNLVSEQIPIGLKGYVVDNIGRKPLFHAVYNQEKVNPVDTRLYEALIGDLNTRLAANGWLVRDKGSYVNEALGKQLIDVTPQNTGIKNGKLYIIDGDVYKK